MTAETQDGRSSGPEMLWSRKLPGDQEHLLGAAEYFGVHLSQQLAVALSPLVIPAESSSWVSCSAPHDDCAV